MMQVTILRKSDIYIYVYIYYIILIQLEEVKFFTNISFQRNVIHFVIIFWKRKIICINLNFSPWQLDAELCKFRKVKRGVNCTK